MPGSAAEMSTDPASTRAPIHRADCTAPGIAPTTSCEALSAAAHADYLLRHCWKAALTISTVRIRPCAGEFEPLTHIADRELAQLICALRLMFPDVGIVLSTRETPKLRNGLIPLGVTMMSAGARTEPGGYTGAGRQNIHQTVRGKIVELASGASEWAATEGHPTNATGQFNVGDERQPQEVGFSPHDCVSRDDHSAR